MRVDPAALAPLATIALLAAAGCGATAGSPERATGPGAGESAPAQAAAAPAPASGSSPAPVALESLEPSTPEEQAVAVMAKIRGSWSPSFSPDASQIAFVSDMNGIPQVWTVSARGGFPTLVTALDDPIGAVTWSPGGDWLAFSVAPGGGFNEQIYVVRPDGSELRRLTEGGSENNFLGDWTEDGRHLSMSSNRRDPASTDSYLIDVASGKPRMVAENRGIGGITQVSRDGARAVVNRLKSRGSNDLYLVDLKGGSPEVLLTAHDGPGTFVGGEFSPDGRTVYLGSNRERDRIAFARVKVGGDGKPGEGKAGDGKPDAGAPPIPIDIIAARDEAELSSLTINEQGTVAALVWNVGGKSELALMDPRSGRRLRAPALPAEIAGGLEFSRDGKRLTLVASGSASPSDVWVLDLASRRFTQVTRSPHAGVDLAKMVRPELVTYKAHDGIELSGWLYRPPGASGPGPIVLSFHGGPEGQERPGFNSSYQALLARGIAVFAPNVRGSSGFGKKFVNLDNGALRADAVKDIKATVDHVVAAGVAHPKRIGIMGGSYGGYMVMAGLTEYPELFAAGANLFGVVNFETFFKHTQPWMAAISTIEYGDPAKEADMLRRLSPIHRIDRIRAPTIVLHGKNDTNVPLVEAEQVVQRLRERGVPVEYVLFPDEGHGWRKTPNRIRSTVSIVRFFGKHLGAK
jgi:dipeptidyl aminopeptidase/acylaminoacyl peptidase